MKYKVNKDEYAKLTEDQRKLYKVDGEDFVLSVEGMPEIPDVSGLKAKNEELLAEKKAQQEAATKAAEEAAAAKAAKDLADANKAGDIDAINKSWQEKYDTLDGQYKGLQGSMAESASESVAVKMASSIAVKGQDSLLLPHIQSRLAAEVVDGRAVVKVLGSDGKPSALTVDELKTEFQNNAAFASVIVGSKARGGGSNNDEPGAGGSGQVISRSQFDEMGAVQKASYLKEGGTLTDEAA